MQELIELTMKYQNLVVSVQSQPIMYTLLSSDFDCRFPYITYHILFDL